ncbi:MAG: Smr/MutS family protein [Bacteroidales bacterium]|jgi:DNA mismatch repair protein MutS2|nr:Smr/MutS family protein [Bacteroidales bacterium]
MIYPNNFEQKIGFDSIREMLKDLCVSDMGVKFVEKIRFSSQGEVISKLLDQVHEFIEILTIGKSFPGSDYFDLRDELFRIKTPGSYIEQEALFDLKTSMGTIQVVLAYFKNSDAGKYTELKKLTEQIAFPDDVLVKAEHIIDDKGDIRDNASARLAEIRKEILQKQRKVHRETKKAFEQAQKAGYIPENAEITIRNGRQVIPLKAAEKRSIGGFIQDESATGQTVFVEPAGSFEANNEIRELENEERREIVKILTQFTNTLRPYIEELMAAYRFLGMIDFIRAKALLSIKIHAHRPVISTEQSMNCIEAVHPLLYLSHKAQKKDIVPLDISLDAANRILIISGPNAGGKSVCLKTVGLLQYMLQCGMPVPASPNSEFSLFSNLFIDIGDEQSLENDLSTYSSHLLNMKYFIKNATNETLFLIDEFGTGTEPQLGASIAEATLEELNKKKAFGVITTHYSNLKLAAERLEGLQNGAMLFDTEKMQPLYILKIGKPGSSFAFEIAKKIGFPSFVLQKAKKKSGGKHVQFDQQLQQLETDKLAIDKKQKQLDSADETLSELVEKYTNLLKDLAKSKKQLIDDAKKEASAIIEDSNKAIEKTIKEIKEAQANKEATKTIRKKLEEKKTQFKKVKTEVDAPEMIETSDELLAGDFVSVIDTDITGELILIEDDEALINVNDIKLRISLDKLEKSLKKPGQKTRRSNSASIINELNQKAARFELSIDLRGKRSEEALYLLQKYIDEALLLSMKEVSILHGKGYGILRDNIREYLRSVDEVKHFEDAPLNLGGTGITRVYFR